MNYTSVMAGVTDQYTSTPYNLSPSSHDDVWYYSDIQAAVDGYVVPVICVFGIIGNLINLIVLKRSSVNLHMGTMEKAVHYGLIALAVSDLLYCLTVLPGTFMSGNHEHPSIDFWLVYATYSNACINCFLLSSSWLTVSMAVCRYVAICHPLYARQYLGIGRSQVIIVGVFVLSILFNVPRFWEYKIAATVSDDGQQLHFKFPGYMNTDEAAHVVFTWTYFIVGILLPLMLLMYCNFYIIKHLYKSSKLHKHHSIGTQDTSHIVTLTLCIIVITYAIFVGPAELVVFWKQVVHVDNVLKYGLAVTICNAFQTLNFAINFILYCIINVHFRRVIRNMMQGHCTGQSVELEHELSSEGSVLLHKDEALQSIETVC